MRDKEFRKNLLMEENDVELFYELRYYFEHEMLPNWFYKKTETFIEKLVEEENNFLYEGMNLLCEDTEQEMRYTREQYKVYRCNTKKEYIMIYIEMPKPEIELLCYQVYLVLSDDYQNKGYYTVERGSSLQERFLCSWDQDQFHSNYGETYEDTSRIERKIAEIFEMSF